MPSLSDIDNPSRLPPDFWELRLEVLRERAAKMPARMERRRWLNGPYDVAQLIYLVRLLRVRRPAQAEPLIKKTMESQPSRKPSYHHKPLWKRTKP